MAQLRDTLIQGSARVTDTLYTTNIAGGKIIQPITWTADGLPEKGSSAEFFLAIDSFQNGGKTYWVSKANTLSAIGAATSGHNHDTTYLKLSGGKMTGRIYREGASTNWNKGRDNALVATSSINGYSPVVSIKTTNGSWDIGAYNNASYTDDLLFSYVTDTVYSGSSAVTTAQIKFLENGHIVATLDGNASNVSGTVTIEHGGTGATTASAAWSALGGGASGKHADSYFVKAITSTDNSIVRFDGTAGQIQGGGKITLSDEGYLRSYNTTRWTLDWYIFHPGASKQVAELYFDSGDATNITGGTLYWRQFSPTSAASNTPTAYHETYSMPTVTKDLTANKTYAIITTKNLSSITSVGTITSGTWNGSKIAASYISDLSGTYKTLSTSQFYGSENTSKFFSSRVKDGGGGWAWTVFDAYKNDKTSILSNFGNFGNENNLTYCYIGVTDNANAYNSEGNVRLYAPTGTTLTTGVRMSVPKLTIGQHTAQNDGSVLFINGATTINGTTKIGANLRLWSDGEGGNIRFYKNNDSNNCTEIDRCIDALRIYRSTNGGSAATHQWLFLDTGNFQVSDGQVKDKNGLVSFVQNSTVISNTTDWNGLMIPGCYKVQMSAWGDAATYHSPNEAQSGLYSFGLLFVMRGAENDGEKRTLQIYFPHRSDDAHPIYCRMANGSTPAWQTWHRLTRGALSLEGGTMTGTIKLAATGLQTNNGAGYTTDQYGNFHHQRATNTDTWCIISNAGTNKATINYETGAATFAGSITANGGFLGNATNVTGTVTYQHGGTGLTTLGSAGQVLKVNSSANGIEWGTVSTADEKVKVAANITTAADYPVVFANSNKSTTAAETAGLNKSGTKFYFNPSTGLLTATQVANAIWNDYAEYRKQLYTIQPGYVIKDTDSGYIVKANERLIPGAQIVSDTWGHSMGKTDECQTPVAVAGRVLAYTYRSREQYHAGMAVCSAPGGTIDIMTREEIRDYPDAIIGIVSEIPDYEEWGSGKVKVNGRIWIKVR